MSAAVFQWLDEFFESGYVELDQGSTALPRQHVISFQGSGVALSDDPSNNRTIVTISAGGGAPATLAANFTQPAVAGTVVAQVSASGGYDVGQVVFIRGGGFYSVTALPDGTHVTLLNTGAKDNPAPGATVTSGPMVLPSGPSPMLVQNNGTPVALRRYLDLVGLGYADDAGGDRMVFTALGTVIGPPTSPIVGPGTTLGTADRWRKMVPKIGGYTITVGTITAGLPFWLSTTPGGGTTFAANPVILSKGANTFTIEDPQNRPAATANTAPMRIDGAVYQWCLDSDNNVLRCMNQVQ